MDPTTTGAMAGPKPIRRRAGLVQERSRRTRQQLVRAALALWAERGFERGVQETTVEEIVTAAGVTKGTFYFHFARKEEILLEMGWETAAVVNEEAARCIRAGRDLDASLARVIRALTRHVKAAPPAAVARTVAEFRRLADTELAELGRPDFGEGLAALLFQAQREEGIPPSADPVELAQMLRVLWMDSVLDWAAGHSDLAQALRRRTSVVVTGVLHGAPIAPPSRGPRVTAPATEEPITKAGASPTGRGRPPLRPAGVRPA